MRRSRRGVTAIEFVLVFPLLLTVAFGLIDWSWYMYENLTVETAAQRGARMGAGVKVADGPEAAAVTAVRKRLAVYGLDDGTASVSATRVTRTYGNVIEVQVSVPFTPLVGLVRVPDRMTAQAGASWYGDLE